MTMEHAHRYPVLTVACGPTNSIRGASYLSSLKDAVVVDVGGTTIGLGGSIVRVKPDGSVTVGPDSVGYGRMDGHV